jgi:hypothetical protein
MQSLIWHRMAQYGLLSADWIQMQLLQHLLYCAESGSIAVSFERFSHKFRL